MNIKSLINWKLFGLLLAGGILGFLSIIPYLLTLQGDLLKSLPQSLPTILVLSGIQNSVMFAIAIFVGLLLAKKVGLGAPLLEGWINKKSTAKKLKEVAAISIKLGLLVGVLIVVTDLVFGRFMEPIIAIHPPIWQGFLASFYGAIGEEILLRLFFMTLLMWLFAKFTKHAAWLAIIVSAIAFGLGHLPVTAQLTALTPIVITRALILNGIGALVFGWLYWKKGIESAMIAHFSADIVLHVFFPAFLIAI